VGSSVFETIEFQSLQAILRWRRFESLTDKTPLKELFERTKFNDVKEQFGPLIPGLFD
jgi:hypothetical protein